MKELTLQELRVMGGKALYKKYGREHFSKMGKRGAQVRKEKKYRSFKMRVKKIIQQITS